MPDLIYQTSAVAISQLTAFLEVPNIIDLEWAPKSSEKVRVAGDILSQGYQGATGVEGNAPMQLTNRAVTVTLTVESLDGHIRVGFHGSLQGKVQAEALHNVIEEAEQTSQEIEVVCALTQPGRLVRGANVLYLLASPGHLFVRGPKVRDQLLPVRLEHLQPRLEESNLKLLEDSFLRRVYQMQN